MIKYGGIISTQPNSKSLSRDAIILEEGLAVFVHMHHSTRRVTPSRDHATVWQQLDCMHCKGLKNHGTPKSHFIFFLTILRRSSLQRGKGKMVPVFYVWFVVPPPSMGLFWERDSSCWNQTFTDGNSTTHCSMVAYAIATTSLRCSPLCGLRAMQARWHSASKKELFLGQKLRIGIIRTSGNHSFCPVGQVPTLWTQKFGAQCWSKWYPPRSSSKN